jgi:hypothetical protein
MEDPMTKPQQNRTNASLDAARAILGGPLTSILDGAFRKMEIAEEEIAKAKRRSPEHAERLHRAFLLLCPSEALASAAERLYRLHCRELLARVAAGDDTRTATNAELASVLSVLSLAAPLDRSATLLYWRIFGALLPKEAEELRAGIGPVAADAYDETCAKDLERTLRKKLTTLTRVLEVDRPASKVA